MVNNKKHTEKRYPGIYSFSKEQENIFFGRDYDIKELTTLIEVENQILLYSKSGIGKTSLLNAGVIPKLSENYIPINIRFFANNNEQKLSPLQRTIDLIKQTHKIKKQNEILLDNLFKKNTKTLWYYIKKLQLFDIDKTFILIFDQFEELFSYSKEQINEFKNNLYELIQNKIPINIAHEIIRKQKNKLITKDNLRFLYSNPEIKIIFAIRSDRLSLLNQLSDKIRNIQQVFYELKPLDNQQARQAITEPAKKKGNYNSPKFEFEILAIDKIINALTDNQKQNIETTQLQIVCQRIEENILNNKIKKKITANDIPDFKDIFLNFYDETINKVTKELIERNNIRKFIEDQLIRNNQRISLDEIICQDSVTIENLKTLTNSHLLRAEKNSTGGFSYELSHDTLIEPILISRKERIAKEEEQRVEKERQKELKLAREKAEKELLERKNAEEQQKILQKALDEVEKMQDKMEKAIFDKAVKEQNKKWNGTKKGAKRIEDLEILEQIYTLNLASNALFRLPSSVSSCYNLRSINLLNNPNIEWEDCFNTLRSLHNLTEIKVSIYNLNDIENIYWNTITGIEILQKGLTKIPKNILKLTQLTFLNIKGNILKLTQEFFKLRNLQYLNLSSCKIDNLPKEIGNLTNLTELYIEGNKLKTIPKEIYN